jgi:hypothetical protein
MLWEKKSERCFVAFVETSGTDIYGDTFKRLDAYRVIREDDGWRADCTKALCGTWLPWEPLTSKRFTSAEAAKLAVKGLS